MTNVQSIHCVYQLNNLFIGSLEVLFDMMFVYFIGDFVCFSTAILVVVPSIVTNSSPDDSFGLSEWSSELTPPKTL